MVTVTLKYFIINYTSSKGLTLSSIFTDPRWKLTLMITEWHIFLKKALWNFQLHLSECIIYISIFIRFVPATHPRWSTSSDKHLFFTCQNTCPGTLTCICPCTCAERIKLFDQIIWNRNVDGKGSCNKFIKVEHIKTTANEDKKLKN